MVSDIAIYILVFLYGIVIGSFLNVCIYRIPKGEDIVKTSSHCMKCNHELKWYDLFPIVSYFMLKGRCRYCGTKLSWQYPLIEGINGILYCIIIGVKDVHMNSVLYCLLVSALLVLSVIDIRTFEIPIGINCFIFFLGVFHVVVNFKDAWNYLLGVISVSVGLFALYVLMKGKGIGGGDIKLMAVSGLLLGWKENILAFFIACVLGSVIHLLRMKIEKKDHVLAFGPYLATGIFISLLWGGKIVDWYINLLGIRI